VKTSDPDTDELLAQASRSDRARQALLARHRDRLRRMVAVRLDRRLAARVDPSDVVQEALAEAAASLRDYLRDRPLPFYPWLRQIAWERLVKLHQRHTARKRSVAREEPLPLPDQSAAELASRLVDRGASPSDAAVREEMNQRVRAALTRLAATDREVLVLRFLERLTTAETAEILGISEGAVKLRQLRAVARLRDRMGPSHDKDES